MSMQDRFNDAHLGNRKMKDSTADRKACSKKHVPRYSLNIGYPVPKTLVLMLIYLDFSSSKSL